MRYPIMPFANKLSLLQYPGDFTFYSLKCLKQIKYVNALLRALLHFADYKAQLSTSALAPIHIPAVHLSEAWEKTLALVHVSVKPALSE